MNEKDKFEEGFVKIQNDCKNLVARIDTLCAHSPVEYDSLKEEFKSLRGIVGPVHDQFYGSTPEGELKYKKRVLLNTTNFFFNYGPKSDYEKAAKPFVESNDQGKFQEFQQLFSEIEAAMSKLKVLVSDPAQKQETTEQVDATAVQREAAAEQERLEAERLAAEKAVIEKKAAEAATQRQEAERQAAIQRTEAERLAAAALQNSTTDGQDQENAKDVIDAPQNPENPEIQNEKRNDLQTQNSASETETAANLGSTETKSNTGLKFLTLFLAVICVAALISGGLSAGDVFDISGYVFGFLADYVSPLVPTFVLAGVSLVGALATGLYVYFQGPDALSNNVPDQPKKPIAQNLVESPAPEWTEFDLNKFTKGHNNKTMPVKGFRVRIKSEQTDGTMYEWTYSEGSEFRAMGWGIYGDDPNPYIYLRPSRADLSIHVPVSECQFDKNHDPSNTQWAPSAEGIMFGARKSHASPVSQEIPEGNPVDPSQYPQPVTDGYSSPVNNGTRK